MKTIEELMKEKRVSFLLGLAIGFIIGAGSIYTIFNL
jgi:hypothetical protein